MTKKQKKELNKILLSLIIFVCLVILEHTSVFPFVFENRLLKLVLYLIPYLICGLDVLKKAIHGIAHRQLFDESFLMTIASVGAFATGEAAEACAVMLFYNIGEFFQDLAVNKSRRSISDLMDIAPEYANIEKEDGSIETIDPEEVTPGDILVIKPGENIPVDGTVISGESFINTSALTGESLPVSVCPDSSVISGCINGEGTLRIRAERSYDDSTVAKILELIESAAEKKSHTEQFITRFARYYTPIVVIAALILAFIPPLFTGDLSVWIYRACTFLVISCPCALVISVPLAFFAGIGTASKNGVLVKGSNYLELLSDIKTLVVDKTGTLTKGTFSVEKIIPANDLSEDEVLKAAAIAESMSTHPIAAPIINEYKERTGNANDVLKDVSVKNISGMGVIASYKDETILAGNIKLMESNDITVNIGISDSSSGVIYIAKNDVYIGSIVISDEIKPEANEAISELKESGIRKTVMLTGDVESVAEKVANSAGIDEVHAALLPDQKVALMEELIKTSGNDTSSKKGTVAYIGDGINDAPVLTRSDIGIAMGSLGSDAAIEAADVVIMDDDLMHLPSVIGIAKKTVNTAKANIIFALAVKVLVLILGALGIANMWAAVFADVGVAILCILNSMRIMLSK